MVIRKKLSEVFLLGIVKNVLKVDIGNIDVLIIL